MFLSHIPTRRDDIDKRVPWGVGSQLDQDFKEMLLEKGLNPECYNGVELKGFLGKLIDDDMEKFNVLKTIVLHHFTFLKGDWTERSGEEFELVKDLCDYDDCAIVAFPSNIEVGYPECLDRFTGSNNKQRLKNMWDNIKSLSPLLTVRCISDDDHLPIKLEYIPENGGYPTTRNKLTESDKNVVFDCAVLVDSKEADE